MTETTIDAPATYAPSMTRCYCDVHDGAWVDWRETGCLRMTDSQGRPRHKHYCRDGMQVFKALVALAWEGDAFDD